METEVRICTLDYKPIEISPCYKTLVERIGLQAASVWTDTVDVSLIVPRIDDE